MHNLMMVAKQHWNAITSDGAALFCCDALCLEMALPGASLRRSSTAAIESRPAMFLVPGFFAV
jgi:hypothetical protein